jgi:uncharacterized protein (TIGR02466 family)
MVANANLTALFATPVMRCTLPEIASQNRKIADYVRESAKNERSIAGYSLQSEQGYLSDIRFLDRDHTTIRTLKSEILKAVNTYLALWTNINRRSLPTNLVLWGWAVLMKEGDSNSPHIHPDACLSGVYYVETVDKPFPQGCIEFINPVETLSFNELLRADSCFKISPAAGELILFPSYLTHYVYPFKGPGERICIAFNVRPANS